MTSRPALGLAQHPIQSFLAGKAAGYEANHSFPSTANVNNEWSYNSTCPYLFMAWFLIKNRDNFIFLQSDD
jgi:hypothetical protein